MTRASRTPGSRSSTIPCTGYPSAATHPDGQFIRAQVSSGNHQSFPARQRRIDVFEPPDVEHRAQFLRRDARKPEQVDGRDSQVPERAPREPALLRQWLVAGEEGHVLLERPPSVPLDGPRERARNSGEAAHDWHWRDAQHRDRRADEGG